jgi:hypothetical protein
MADEPSPISQSPEKVQTRLHELAQMLREANHLEPATQKALAELADELASAGDFSKASSAEVGHLLESSSRVIELLHRRPEAPIPATVRDRFEQAILAAESRAPVLAGVAHRLLDVLADLGI